MKWKHRFRLRSVAMVIIIGASLTMVVFNLYLQRLLYNRHVYVAGLNLKFSGTFSHWPIIDTGSTNETRLVHENITIATQEKEFLFLEWQSGNDRDLNVREQLMEASDKVKVTGINCQALFTGLDLNNAMTQTKANKPDIPLSDNMYVNLTADCERFQTSRGYIMSSLTKEEEDFPLAFSMIVFKDVEMVERLLRAIYRPQNYYCIHVDKKASVEFYNAASAIIKCFPNVFMASRRISVEWGYFSVLEPELVCMQDLWKYPKWKYFINLTGQEFPLKTNLELVKILTAFRGASDIQTKFKCANTFRWHGKVPPHGLRPAKGSVHIAVSRIFVDYILHNKTAQEILEWTNETLIPDEAFFAILNANPQLGIKGTYTGTQDACDDRPTMTRYKMIAWQSCAANRYVRKMCILTTGDLPRLREAKQLFANKFYLHEDRTVIGCLEEKIFNDTRDEYLGLKTFNASFYSTLEFVIHQVT